MATSSVELCNGAIIICGGEPINSLSDTTKPARVCNERYAKVLKQFISSHPWNFATYRQQIAADGSLPTGWWGWTYAHSLSSDVLRVLEIQDGDTLPWAVESGRKLFANHTPVDVEYIKNVTDTTLFPPYFEKAFEHVLALDICYVLTQSATLVKEIKERADMAVREARSFDAQEKSIQAVVADTFVAARY